MASDIPEFHHEKWSPLPNVPDLGTTEQWCRLPKRTERLSGLSRTTLCDLAYRGLIRSAVLRKPGSKRSIRLIWIPSLLAYLDSVSQPAGGGVPPAKEKPRGKMK